MKEQLILIKILKYAEELILENKGQSFEEFMEDNKLRVMLSFNLSQIGELINQMDSIDLLISLGESPKKIYGLRNRIVHDYSGISWGLMYQIFLEDIKKLKLTVEIYFLTKYPNTGINPVLLQEYINKYDLNIIAGKVLTKDNYTVGYIVDGITYFDPYWTKSNI